MGRFIYGISYLIAFVLFLFTILLDPTLIYAEGSCPQGQIMTELRRCIPTDPVPFVLTLYSMFLGLIGGVGVLYAMYGGYLVMTSQGDAHQIRVGRSYLTYSLVGIVLALSGFSIYQLIARGIKIPGF